MSRAPNNPAGVPNSSPGEVAAPSFRLTDSFGRAITDLRVSLTDRCNYQCVYRRSGSAGAHVDRIESPAAFLRKIAPDRNFFGRVEGK
jgi:hypothetical protein